MQETIQLRPDPRPISIILARHFAIVCVFNTAFALVSMYGLNLGESFTENLVFSMCIGLLAWLFIDGGRLLIWGRGLPPRLPFIALVLGAMPLARFLGNAIATRILGLNPEHVAAYQGKNVASMVILTVFACLTITWFFWRRGEVAMLRATVEAEKARATAIEKQAIQAQLQMLQAQVEPHMLFNTLANLQGLIAMDPPRAQHMLDQLIQYLRATLSASRSEQTMLAQEFKLVDAFLGLMKVRMGSRLAYSLELPEDLATLSVPPMLLQPLVENAIKHGIEPKVDGGHITIRATREAGTLELTVADTGLGLDAPPQDGTRVGNANLRERLKVLFGDRASFELNPNTPQGAIARIRLPL
ncbi:MAG TPA: histidine kinase [Noviherbaspirillum sp.]